MGNYHSLWSSWCGQEPAGSLRAFLTGAYLSTRHRAHAAHVDAWASDLRQTCWPHHLEIIWSAESVKGDSQKQLPTVSPLTHLKLFISVFLKKNIYIIIIQGGCRLFLPTLCPRLISLSRRRLSEMLQPVKRALFVCRCPDFCLPGGADCSLGHKEEDDAISGNGCAAPLLLSPSVASSACRQRCLGEGGWGGRVRATGRQARCPPPPDDNVGAV